MKKKSISEKNYTWTIKEALEHGILIINEYIADTESDAFISDLVLGAKILCTISENYEQIKEHQRLFDQFYESLSNLCKKEIADEKNGGLNLLCDIFCPGRELFPDKEKYPWWWLPETLMTKNQLEKWKKYVKSRNYKYN